MKDMLMMIPVVAFLSYLLVIRDTKGKKNSFFDMDTTTTMRGFWCLIVMLVHVPALYQNPIQDMLGSFAYIGVSFFFMTSSYGLVLSVRKNPASLEEFWKRRLPKLLLPMLAVNVLTLAADCVMGKADVWTLVRITGFVRQLLLFYLVFWIVFRIPGLNQNQREWILCGCVVVLSLLIYWLDGMYLFSWPVESFGFLYGVLLARYADTFIKKTSSRWLIKCTVGCVAALLLGVLYLKTKHVAFWGDYMIKIMLGIGILLFMLCVNTRYSMGNRVGRFLGGISYEVYLVHSLVYQCVHYIVKGLDSGVYVLICMVITVAVSVLVHWICKPILRCVK